MYIPINQFIFIFLLTVVGACFSFLGIGRRSGKIFLYLFSFFLLHLAAQIWSLRPAGLIDYGLPSEVKFAQIIAGASKLAFPVLAYGCFASWRNCAQAKKQSVPMERRTNRSTAIWGGGLIVWSVCAILYGEYGKGGHHFMHSPFYWTSPLLLIIGIIVVLESISE